MIQNPMDGAACAFGKPGFGGGSGTGFAGGRRAMLGQTFDQMMGLPPWAGDVIRLAVHGSTGALGVYVGTLERGIVSVLGWIVGIMSGFAAILDIASLIGRAFGRE